MARVLFTSSPAYGHVLPMLPVVRAATRAGHEVRLATGPDLIDPLVTRGLDVRAVGPTWAEGWSANQAVWADPSLSEEHKMMGGVVALFGKPALARLHDLAVMAQEWRPHLIVHEVLETAGPLLARRLNVPGVVHGIGPMFPFYAQLIAHLGEAMGEPDLWAQASSEQALDLCPISLQPEGTPPWAVATPLRPSAGEPGHISDRVASVLAAGSPVAYFTLGTVKNADAADFTASASFRAPVTTGSLGICRLPPREASPRRGVGSTPRSSGQYRRTPSSRSSSHKPRFSDAPTYWPPTPGQARCWAASFTASLRSPFLVGRISRRTLPWWPMRAPGSSSPLRATPSTRYGLRSGR